MPRALDATAIAILHAKCPQVLAHPLAASLDRAEYTGGDVAVTIGGTLFHQQGDGSYLPVGPALVGLPVDMLVALCEYLATAYPLGDFLSALVANDLHRAATNADSNNAPHLANFGIWIAQSWPYGAYGSYDKLDAWEGVADA